MELLSSRGRVLTYIAHHPGCGVKDMADGMFLTQRTIWGVIGQLRPFLRITKHGKEHSYEVADMLLCQTLFALDKWTD